MLASVDTGRWKMFAVQPVRVYPGVQVAQIFYHTLEGAVNGISEAASTSTTKTFSQACCSKNWAYGMNVKCSWTSKKQAAVAADSGRIVLARLHHGNLHSATTGDGSECRAKEKRGLIAMNPR